MRSDTRFTVFAAAFGVALLALAFVWLVLGAVSSPGVAVALGAGLAAITAFVTASALAVRYRNRAQAIVDIGRRYALGDLSRPGPDYGDDDLGMAARALDAAVHEQERRITSLARDRARMQAILGSMVEGVLVVDSLFRRLQLVSAALFSLGHGANDAQKTMGIIASALFAGGYIATFEIPLWVELAAYTAIAAGTLSGGWRIIHTMGSKITRLQPVGGFAAETAGAVSLFVASSMGVPVSTTHTITGAIVGVGSVRRMSAVRWGIAGQIVWAWVLTIPASAIISAATYYLLAAAGVR